MASMFTFSRGSVIRDAYPEQRTAASFGEFAEAILSDRAQMKGQVYFCGPLKVGDSGKAHRCKADVLPRMFVALDLDGMADAVTFEKLRAWLQRYEGFAYTTASHKPETPRARVVLALSRPVIRDEGILVSQALQAQIEKDFGRDAIKFDKAAHNAEQALYTPLHDAESFRFEGTPIDVNLILTAIPTISGSEVEATSASFMVIESDPIIQTLYERDMVKSYLDDGKFAIECPFSHEHSAPSTTSSTVYMLPGTRGHPHGSFKCMHDHCRERRQEDFAKALGLDPTSVRDAHSGHRGGASVGYARHAKTPVKTKPRFSFTAVQDLRAMPTEVNWLIDGFIEESSLTLLYGASGAGKSFVTLGMAASIATGTPWFDRAVKQGPVVYIAGEGHSGIRRRLKACEQHNGERLPDNSLLLSDGAASLMDEGSAKAVSEAIREFAAVHGQPALIVIDTLHRNLGGGDENSAADISTFLANVDTHLRGPFGCAVLTVHHTGHQDQKGARGSSSIRAAVDHEFLLEVSDDLRILTCTKLKDGVPPRPLTLELRDVPLGPGLPALSAVLVPAGRVPSRSPGAKPLSEATRLALRSLSEAADRAGISSSSALGVFPPETPEMIVSEDEWRLAAYSMGISSGGVEAKRKAFGRAKESLKVKGFIGEAHGYVWVRSETSRDSAGHCLH